MHRTILALAYQRHVEGDDVARRGNLVNRSKIATLSTLSRRVAADHFEPPTESVLFDQSSNISHANNAQTMIAGFAAIALGCALQSSRNPLQHTARIAPRSRCNLYIVRTTIVQVDMIVTDCSSGYKTYLRVVEQSCIALCSGANDQGVAVAHRLGVEPFACEILHLGVWLEHPRNKRNCAINRDFHIRKGSEKTAFRYCLQPKMSANSARSLHNKPPPSQTKKSALLRRTCQFVGETGFEPATSNSRSWRANRTALHPEIACAKIRKIILNYQIILGLMSKKITLRL